MDWKAFLSDVSKTVINNKHLLDEFRDLGNNDWLGFSPITQQEIQTHEQRLNSILPPSYKEFLKASNGFKQLNCFLWNILPINKVDWLVNFDNEFYNLYKTEFVFNVTDEDYFVYGEDQWSVNFRSDYLLKTLAISGWGDSSIILLNPEVKFGEEWEAWVFANWYPGAHRYQSFEELMKDNYLSYLDLLNNKSE